MKAEGKRKPLLDRNPHGYRARRMKQVSIACFRLSTGVLVDARKFIEKKVRYFSIRGFIGG